MKGTLKRATNIVQPPNELTVRIVWAIFSDFVVRFVHIYLQAVLTTLKLSKPT